MRHADMKFEWFLKYQRGEGQPVENVGGKSSTWELADKGRKSWIARLHRSNTWGGTFIIGESGVREV